ncbi:MAG: carbon-nitrogen hydrolase family protein [Hyphomicrobiaceae bacterium]|nr:carbon-nitrogen hydrolase family protein [Hyphomicrobiaceae bacterium]MCC0009584.1 carbon-nitrogen hydrolase family protein [Hyphomicrobiaceae bacterium]
MTSTPGNAKFRAGLVQMCAGRDLQKNVDDASALIRGAASAGAQYVQTPEVTTLMELDRERLFAAIDPEQNNAALAHFQRLAHELGIWLHIGSMAVKVSDDKLANRTYVINADGNIAARYDKIHMFDVDLENGESYNESRNYEPGSNAVVVDLPWGRLGLTICYDLRFPYLHRALAKAGADFIAGPAAFTKTTGEAHWHALLRARAIETQCYILAAAQTGLHEMGRATYGHSIVIAPWGETIAEAGTEPGFIIADIDRAVVTQVRDRVPALKHDRAFKVVEAGSDPGRGAKL